MDIYKSISAIMAEGAAVSKNEPNTQQNYKYRSIDAVMNAFNPLLAKHSVFTVPEVLEQSREERTTSRGGLLIYSTLKVKYTFFAEDGSSVSAVVIGEGMDSGDKSSNKAMSAAYKYALFQVFCIPTEEMIDGDKDSPEPTPKQAEKPAPQQTKPAQVNKPAETAKTAQAAENPPQAKGYCYHCKKPLYASNDGRLRYLENGEPIFVCNECVDNGK